MKDLEKELKKAEKVVSDGGFRQNEIAHLGLLLCIARGIDNLAKVLEEIKDRFPAQPETKSTSEPSSRKK